MGTKFAFRIFIGLILVNVTVIFMCAVYFFSTFKKDELVITNSAQDPNENLIPICGVDENLLSNIQHNCTLLDVLSLEDHVASGWTKTVYRSKINGTPVAIKSVNSKGKDIRDCSENKPVLTCFNEAVEKFEREIHLLRQLTHPVFIKLVYFCQRTKEQVGCMKHAISATELGEPLSNIKLLQMGWKQRKHIIQDLARLIYFAENNPLGSLGLADLRRPQFVLVKGRLKMADLDDVLIGEPACSSDKDCANLNITIPCNVNRCVGYNVKLNIQKSYKEFAPYIFLVDDVPEMNKTKIQELRQIWLGNNVTAEQLLHLTKLL